MKLLRGLFLCLHQSRLARSIIFYTWLFLHLFVHLLSYFEQDNLKTNAPILLQFCTSCPWCKGMKWSVLRVRRLKVKATHC